MTVVLSVLSLLVTIAVLLVQVGFWGGGISARAKPDDENGESTPGRLRKVIDDVERTAKGASAVAHDARNIANGLARQVERDRERLDRHMQENTRRIDELWRVRSSGEGT